MAEYDVRSADEFIDDGPEEDGREDEFDDAFVEDIGEDKEEGDE